MANKNISPSKVLTLFIVVVLAVFLIVPLLNLKVDLYRIFTGDSHYIYGTSYVNHPYLKVKHVLDNSDKYDSLFFGSSRVFLGIDADQLEKNLGGRWYKLAFARATLSEAVHSYEALLRGGFVPKKIIVSVEEESLYNDNSWELYPFTYLDWLYFYKTYLWQPITKIQLSILLGKRQLLLNEDPSTLRTATSKSMTKKKMNHLLTQSLDYHLNKPEHWLREYEAVKKFVALSEQYGVKVDVIYQPKFFRTYYSRDLDEINRLKQHIAKLTPFYDFATFSDEAYQYSYWMDTSHYNGELGKQILVLLSQGGAKEIGEFGYRVTQRSVDKHLDIIRKIGMAKIAAQINDNQIFLSPSFLDEKFRLQHTNWQVNGGNIVAKSESSVTVKCNTEKPTQVSIATPEWNTESGDLLNIIFHDKGKIKFKTLFDFQVKLDYLSGLSEYHERPVVSEVIPSWSGYSIPLDRSGVITKITFNVPSNKLCYFQLLNPSLWSISEAPPNY